MLEIKLHVTNGKLIASGNGNPIDHNMSFDNINLFNGLALVIVSKNSELTVKK